MAQRTQEEDKEGIARMQRMVHESEEIGVATNIKLKMQTEQLKTIGVDVATVQARMKDANKLLNQMGRRMATDKFLMFFIGPSLVCVFRACSRVCVRVCGTGFGCLHGAGAMLGVVVSFVSPPLSQLRAASCMRCACGRVWV